jgi:glycerol dehydrogenase-like iron-containing ADH family enzyme
MEPTLTPLLETVTPLGLVALVIVLGYFAAQKIGDKVAAHLEQQNLLLNQLLTIITKCAEELKDIQESFQDFDKK